MMIRPWMVLAVVAAGPFGSGALAGDFGTTSLAAGEVRTIRASVASHDIRICNDMGSAGDLVAVIGGANPVRLTPGMCERDRGDRFELRNTSTGTIVSTYAVSMCEGQH